MRSDSDKMLSDMAEGSADYPEQFYDEDSDQDSDDFALGSGSGDHGKLLSLEVKISSFNSIILVQMFPKARLTKAIIPGRQPITAKRGSQSLPVPEAR